MAGAWADGSIGEHHSNETRLIPLILQVPLKKRDFITIYGNDYPTPDGTCSRGYVHVCDLVDAHISAIDFLRNSGDSNTFNLGNGEGFSVKEIIQAAELVTSSFIPTHIGQRRKGDPARLAASSSKVRQILGWKPTYTKIADITATAWKWHSLRPNGYEDE